MQAKAGFTLLELLITAAIIGVLAMFATQSFRASSAEIRVQDARTRAQAIAMAVRRFKLDYPSAAYPGNGTTIGALSDNEICDHSDIGGLQNLINCGYLERRQVMEVFHQKADGTWVMASSFTWTFGSNGSVCIEAPSGSKAASALAAKDCTDGEEWSI